MGEGEGKDGKGKGKGKGKDGMSEGDGEGEGKDGKGKGKGKGKGRGSWRPRACSSVVQASSRVLCVAMDLCRSDLVRKQKHLRRAGDSSTFRDVVVDVEEAARRVTQERLPVPKRVRDGQPIKLVGRTLSCSASGQVWKAESTGREFS